MSMKGSIKPDNIPNNKYKLLVLGLPELTVVSQSAIEEVLKTVDLPDGTRASAGETNPVEFDVTLPAHHIVEDVAMELWFQEGQNPVSPTYKKGGTLILKSLTENIRKSYTMIGLFIMQRTIPEKEMGGDGDMATTVWKLSADDILPTP